MSIDEEKAGRYLDEIRSLHAENDRLERELSTARRDLHEERGRANDYSKVIDRERAAHERTKAELAEARQHIETYRATAKRVCSERDAAQARADKAEADAAATVFRFKSLLTESAKLTGRDRESWLPFVLMLIDQVAAESPGRDLAARVELLEATLRVFDDAGMRACSRCRTVIKNMCGPWPRNCPGCGAELAVFDAKGGG